MWGMSTWVSESARSFPPVELGQETAPFLLQADIPTRPRANERTATAPAICPAPARSAGPPAIMCVCRIRRSSTIHGSSTGRGKRRPSASAQASPRSRRSCTATPTRLRPLRSCGVSRLESRRRPTANRAAPMLRRQAPRAPPPPRGADRPASTRRASERGSRRGGSARPCGRSPSRRSPWLARRAPRAPR